MMQQRWLTRHWKEYGEHGVSFKHERVLQYRCLIKNYSLTTSGISGVPVTEEKWSEWQDTPEESIDL